MTLEQMIYDKLPTLSAGQKKVAEYILGNKDSFSYATLAKLSKAISVSETTIIRLSYSLGFDSFSAMQQKLREEILQTPQRATIQDAAQSTGTIRKTLNAEVACLTNWIATVDETLILNIIDTLIKADRILIAGARSSFNAANWFGNRLNLLLGNTYVIHEFYDSRFDLLSSATDQTVLISIAFARYTKWTYQYASSMKKHGATLISFTDVPSSPFVSISDYSVLAAPLKDQMGFSSMVCLYSLFDAIIAKIRDECHEHIGKRLELFELTYSDFDFFYE